MKIPTHDIWTSGISNIPKHDRNSRYTFFELDTKDIDKVHFVLDVYRENLETCYVHELINGFHFFNLRAIEKERYNRIIRIIKFLNTECPLTVLRIIPNKWQNEKRYWNISEIIGNSKELEQFRTCIETQTLGWIKDNYEVVRYPFEECPKCRKSNSVYWSYPDNCFMCRTCNIQTIGRIKPKPTMNLEDRIAHKRSYRHDF